MTKHSIFSGATAASASRHGRHLLPLAVPHIEDINSLTCFSAAGNLIMRTTSIKQQVTTLLKFMQARYKVQDWVLTVA